MVTNDKGEKKRCPADFVLSEEYITNSKRAEVSDLTFNYHLWRHMLYSKYLSGHFSFGAAIINSPPTAKSSQQSSAAS